MGLSPIARLESKEECKGLDISIENRSLNHKKNIADQLIGLFVLAFSHFKFSKPEKNKITGTTHTITGSYPFQF